MMQRYEMSDYTMFVYYEEERASVGYAVAAKHVY